jgi:hypothetical protein
VLLNSFKLQSKSRRQKEGIDLSELPRIFRDVVEVARYLDIRYLWIDALYIIQGADGDWASESGKIAEYYEQAMLTIIATKQASPLNSLYNGRPVPHMKAKLQLLTRLLEGLPGSTSDLMLTILDLL